MKTEKYTDLDKSISKEILKEFKGKVIPEVCMCCKGEKKNSTGDKCNYCGGLGFVNRQY
jgi:hypothetical protein